MSKVKIMSGGDELPINCVVNQNGGGPLKFWKGTIDEYGQLASLDPDTMYFIEQNATQV